MNFCWFVLIFTALMACVMANSCPTGFSEEQNRCIKDRPVHGTCPPGSNYQLNINKCVLA
ncbi:uncharacterized protein LOC115625273 [Scaptodrosophila lebanonensis]|uniref:Uncharacterized protein LOC115625273 n=1 Tax=Drosophila lebanonensis TaxID=7225 RepID=A0A6J2THG5_DROLE|nr:uncharacterized protein LOC115625273 [Scaptodrosophila lebanonensis]